MDSEVMEQRLKQWLPIFEAQAQSGLNKQDWCEQNGIKRHSFFKWQRECRAYLLSKQQNADAMQIKSDPSFVEISCTQGCAEVVSTTISSNTSPEPSPIVISSNGFSISVNGQFDEVNLAKVLKVISYVH